MLQSLVTSGLARTNLSRRGLLVLAIVMLCIGVAGLLLLFQLVPSSQQTFHVTVSNDRSQAVVVEHCSNAGNPTPCATTDESLTMAPGGTFTTMTGVPGSNPFMVKSTEGLLLGCLPLEFATQPEGTPTVLVSEAVPCAGLV